MKAKLLTLVTLFSFTTTMAQWREFQTANDSIVSTEVLEDNKVIFRIYAPQANEVQIGGDIWNLNVKFLKDNRGIWEGMLENVAPGAYRYHFIVDGVKVYDPKNSETSETSALLKIEPKGNEFFSIKNIPHGAIAQRYYHSRTLNAIRRMHVWTPPGYEKNTEKLPVLYLIHGGGDTDKSWPTVGCAGFILDNLYAEKKIKPMIVVMPNGTIEGVELIEGVKLFANDLMNDIIPFIENNYRVLINKDSRALSGLSMGGMQALEAGLNHYQKFGYLWILSSGWWIDDTKTYEVKGKLLKEIAPDFNRNVRALHFTQGGPEDIAYNNCKGMLKLFDAAGINYKYSDSPGGHSWYTWRNDLYNMAQQLFKE